MFNKVSLIQKKLFIYNMCCLIVSTCSEFFLLSSIPDFPQAEYTGHWVEEEQVSLHWVLRIDNHRVNHYILQVETSFFSKCFISKTLVVCVNVKLEENTYKCHWRI